MPLWDNALGTEFVKRDGLLGVNMDESMKNMRACLSVGRYNRAEAILRRLTGLAVFNVSEIKEANNTYLRSLMHALFRGTEGITLTKIQSWFEVDMRQLGIEPDATTLALMVRTSFLLTSTKARERTIRRYLHIAEEMHLLDATMSSGEYLPEEFNTLCQIQKDLFEQIPQESEDITTDAQRPLVHRAPQTTEALNLKSSEQKGLGLSTLLHGLRSMYVGEKTGELDDFSKYNWQVALEQDIVNAQLERWRTQHADMVKMGINTALTGKYMEALLWTWQEKLQASVQKQIDEMQRDTAAYMSGDGPYLEQLGAQKLSAVTILETLRVIGQSSDDDGVGIYRIIAGIGSALEMEGALRNYQQRKDNKTRQTKQVTRKFLVQRLRKGASLSQSTAQEQTEDQASSKSRENRSIEWPKTVRMRAAGTLFSKLLEVAKIPIVAEGPHGRPMENAEVTYEPAFSHSVIFRHGKQRGMVAPNPELQTRLSREPPPANLAHQLPMVAKPEPWSDARGAYLRYPANLMRLKDTSGIQDMYMHAAVQEGNLKQIFDGLNVLGRAEWTINEPLFNVMAQAWNTGEAFTNIPAANPVLVLPEEPSRDSDLKDIYTWQKAVKRLKNEQSGFHSNRCAMNAQMEIARAFVGQSFYLPHNLDFRGRAYPIGGIFNHMGADNARGLFQFAKGKELGETGLFWLRNHLANKFGFDKADLKAREQFTFDHWEDIKDSAENPLDGKRWWVKAEDPWQCLAACFELVNAMKSPDPTTFLSHLPVHQDGTCNGLQHYAALGGDSLGAAQVNLLPRDRPGDIYSEVARLVIEDVDRDIAAGDPLAKCLAGKISRKVVKQPVMTYAYGVTYHGAKMQILKRLDEIIPNGHLNEYGNSVLASYLTKKVFKNFGSLFTGATKIQHWLAACAGRISTAVSPKQMKHALAVEKKKHSKSKFANQVTKKMQDLKFQSAVIWTTPLNLPVVQPYRNIENTKIVNTAIQSMRVLYPSPGDVVSKKKQMTGFPPNFIHSLDASHMLLSAVKCDQQGMTFASVHDSFWTHACDIPAMNENLRDAFVQIHSEDIIGRLAQEFNARYKSYMFQRSVPLHSPLGQRINALRRKNLEFAQTEGLKKSHRRKVHFAPSLSELEEECKRVRLLNSNDPKERAKAEAMETPASLFDALGPGHPDLVVEATTTTPDQAVNETATPLAADSTDNVDFAPEESDVAAVIQDPVYLANLGAEVDPVEDSKDGETLSAQGHIVGSPRKSVKQPRYITFWTTLDFPEVPKRGDFDVQEVKNSTYFFS